MSWVDITFLIIVGVNGLLGLWRGVIREAFTLLGIVAGAIIASRTYEMALPVVGKILANPNLARIISFLLIFLVTAVLAHLLGVAIRKLFKIILLGWLERLLGFLFGLIKGIAIVLVVIILLLKFPVGSSKGLLEDSIIASYAFILLKLFLPLLPEGLSEIIQKFLPKSPLQV